MVAVDDGDALTVASAMATSLAAEPARTASGDIQIQLRRSGTAITVARPVSAAASFAAWMREPLR